MVYHIKDYTKKQAESIGLEVRPSTKGNYKIDVYKDGDYITSIGNKNYKDYPTYLLLNGKAYADERRRLYYARHKKDLNYFRGLLTAILLW
jgi:hypothetical protein